MTLVILKVIGICCRMGGGFFVVVAMGGPYWAAMSLALISLYTYQD